MIVGLFVTFILIALDPCAQVGKQWNFPPQSSAQFLAQNEYFLHEYINKTIKKERFFDASKI